MTADMSKAAWEKPFEDVASQMSSNTEFKEQVAFGSPTPEDVQCKQQLNFDGGKVASEEPCTPATPILKKEGGQEPATPGSDDNAVNYNQFMFETITWVNKLRSILYFVGGLLVIGLSYQIIFSSTTLVTGLCYIALAQMALNFSRQLISPAFQERCTWYDSVWTYAAIHSFGNALKAVAALNDRHMNGADPVKTLRIGVGLWLVSILGRYVSAFQLAVGLWVLAFTLPKLYTTYQQRVARVTGQAYTTAKTKFYSVDKRARALVIMLPIMVAGYVLSRVDFIVAMFLLLVHVRYWMHPKHVELVKKNLVPITNTASKLGSRFGSFAMDQALAYDVYPTPTPAKPKRN